MINNTILGATLLMVFCMLFSACTGEREYSSPAIDTQAVQAALDKTSAKETSSPDTATAYPDKADIHNGETPMFITAEQVNLRQSPSKDGKILHVLGKNQAVSFFGETNGWGYVSFGKIEGYISMQFLSETSPAINTGEISNNTKTTKLIAIDAGHQAKANNKKEPIGPGSSETKAKVASGTQGIITKIPEYQLTLDVSLKLEKALIARGYKVYMVRETHDVNISNMERAKISAENGADILVRIHANGSENPEDEGALTISPTEDSIYIPQLYEDCYKLSKCILDGLIKTTKAVNKGVWQTDTMSGINWSTIPVTIVEMGFMSNKKEDKLMQTDEYQEKIVDGISNGIDEYFNG